MDSLATIATCALNQWALDFEGNLRRIKDSIKIAKAKGAASRIGPELEICGYGLLDHLLEQDTYTHSWECVAEILKDPELYDILIDVGAPVEHRGVRYNCRIIILNGNIHLVRPKLALANDGNYREKRYFTEFKQRIVEDYYLPDIIAGIPTVARRRCPFGDALLVLQDTCIGIESCEELFTERTPHSEMFLDGAEILLNSSGSHTELRKLDVRVALIMEATRKTGGCYMYSNQLGCDGDRLYYDGCAMVVLNGQCIAQGSQYALKEVEVLTATIDLTEIRSARTSSSRGFQARSQLSYKRIDIDYRLSTRTADNWRVKPSVPINIKYYRPEEEIAYGPAVWLWDYLRRSGQGGFFLALSGGIDSCSTALIVSSMTKLVIQALQDGNKQVEKDVRRITNVRESDRLPSTPQELCHLVFHTAYMGMETQSSAETRRRARELSQSIGSFHLDFDIDRQFDATKTTMMAALGIPSLNFKQQGGTRSQGITLQNIQARLRMVDSYAIAAMIPEVRGRKGSLLVLGAGNVDEALRGYYTKYDASSADLNPIGSISKIDLRSFVAWCRHSWNLPLLDDFLNATPTAELEPISDTYVQSDEADMGVTYAELSVFGRLRKVFKLGPYGTFQRLLREWGGDLSPRQIAEKTKHFYFNYSINRHKMTTLTPSYHAESYSPDDNRFDLRPFLLPANFPWQNRRIDEEVAAIEAVEEGRANGV
ncbi:MAG: glutamine-dependent NAD(+) synthetase [Bogoriella megaspora]|nr:MAG: glutamine-dependent NAD(+) synthetase [Bogoriella megaspora]